ncbi:MAG TPA: hypothetical protein PKA17_07665, partial [Phenylobacterium sp.]|nr:hypothetical protein [Phenylobacterium sp.]
MFSGDQAEQEPCACRLGRFLQNRHAKGVSLAVVVRPHGLLSLTEACLIVRRAGGSHLARLFLGIGAHKVVIPPFCQPSGVIGLEARRGPSSLSVRQARGTIMYQKLNLRGALLTSISALAASAAAPTVASAQAVEVQELIITATRRDSTVQDAPINIAAVGAAELRTQGLNDLSDVAKWVPGIHIVDQGSRGDNR